MSLGDYTKGSALAEMSEIFFSALYIIVIPEDNHVYPL
jgi:hypothetical protein